MSRVYNFSAGPAVLPEEVLQELALREGTSGLVEKANRKES